MSATSFNEVRLGMQIIINGDGRTVDDSLTLLALVLQLGAKPERVAVEVNRKIVSRDQWQHTTLHDGDRLEIVHFVGGG